MRGKMMVVQHALEAGMGGVRRAGKGSDCRVSRRVIGPDVKAVEMALRVSKRSERHICLETECWVVRERGSCLSDVGEGKEPTR